MGQIRLQIGRTVFPSTDLSWSRTRYLVGACLPNVLTERISSMSITLITTPWPVCHSEFWWFLILPDLGVRRQNWVGPGK